MDGRPDYESTNCVPSLEGVHFLGGHVCEADCFATDTCRYHEHGVEYYNESAKLGNCTQIESNPDFTHHLFRLYRNSTEDVVLLEMAVSFVTHLEFIGWAVGLLVLIVHLSLYALVEDGVCASHLEESVRLMKALGSVSAVACLGIARSIPAALHRVMRHRFLSRADFVMVIFSFFVFPIGIRGLQVKIMSVAFVGTVPIIKWTLKQWVAVILFSNNMLRMGGDFASLTKPSGLVQIESLLKAVCKCHGHERFVSIQHWLYKFETALVEDFGKTRALVVFATLQPAEVHLLLNESWRNEKRVDELQKSITEPLLATLQDRRL